jgi:intracellular septation protein
VAILTDLLPLFVFFLAYRLSDIYVATGVLLVVTCTQLLVNRLRGKPVAALQLVSAAIVLLFGGLTIALHDETFVKWKPTLVNWLFAAAFLGSEVAGSDPLVQRLLGGQATLPAGGWRRLNRVWAAFFAALGALNLVVAYRYSTDVWVQFKVFGLLGLTVAFVVLQSVWLGRVAGEPSAGD